MSTVAFQGDHGAFSEEAAYSLVGEGVETLPCREFSDVGAALRNGEADLGVLPIENSIAGIVDPSKAVIESEEFRVVGEITLPIRHFLLARRGVAMDQVRHALSHPVALAQCRDFLLAHPTIQAVPWYDTGGAARHVATAGDDTLAAIASQRAAARYGLMVLAGNIEDTPDNRTRFVLVALRDGKPARADHGRG